MTFLPAPRGRGDPNDPAIGDVIEAPSPNHEARRPAADGRADPSLIVLHHTAMATAAAALERLRDPAAKVSAHYVIDVDGRLYRLVAERDRAWHAGVASWRGETDVNSRSIGIELAHPGGPPPGVAAPRAPFGPPYPEAQIARLEALLASILRRWSLSPSAVVAHSDVAPGRKRDPGPLLDWQRLARRGLAADPPRFAPEMTETPAPADPDAAFAAALAEIGYGPWPMRDLVDAFRLRWRPAAAAPRPEAAALAPSAADRRLATALAARPRPAR